MVAQGRVGRPARMVVHARLQAAVDELRSRMGGLPSPAEAEGIWGDIWYQEAHHSTAIEGNTLVLKQVRLLLAEGRAVGDRELRDYLEVRGYATAARWVYDQAHHQKGRQAGTLLSLAEVRQVHHQAMAPVWEVTPHPAATADEAPGGFRRHDIVEFPGGMTPPPWTDVPALMTDWVANACRLPDDERPPALAVAACHADFERIHPFLDGNGRAGRLLTNLLLVRLGYPPAIIYTRDRSRYLNALTRADAGDPGPLGELLARSILDTLYRFIVPAVAGPSRLVPLAALASKDVTHRALRDAAERNRLRAIRGADGQWRSTRRWVDDYRRDRHSRRPR